MPCSLSDVPEPAISRIIKYARSRLIPGTNKHALVCRSWRNASAGTHDEQLQLYIDIEKNSSTELAACRSWLQLHGNCVVRLTVDDGRWLKVQPILFKPAPTPTWISSHLTHLDLGNTNLLSLVPYLQQLPGLQHLGVSVAWVTRAGPWQQWDGENKVAVPEVPDLDLLCPQLVSLHLRPRPGNDESWAGSVNVDPVLTQLLPGGLRKLHFEEIMFIMSGAHFTHLSALEDLTLELNMLVHPEHLVDMSRLQRLRLCLVATREVPLLPLASKLVELSAPPLHTLPRIPAAALRDLTALTSLYLEEPLLGEEPPAVNPLANLPSLNHLYLDVPGGEAQGRGWMLRGLSSISSLRSLMLRCYHNNLDAELVGVVGQATQLTCLWLTQLWWVSESPHRNAVCSSVSQALQQLTGLQQLALHREWLVADGTLLTNLQQLMLLIVSVEKDVEDNAPVELMVQPLQGRPIPKLQHVVLTSDDLDWHSAVEAAEEAEVAPSPLPGVCVMLAAQYLGYERAFLRPRQLRPCPHLAGVFEVLSQV